jgi:putative membrane protein
MTGHAHRILKLSLALLCVGAVGACKKADNAVDTAAARTDSAAGRLDSTAATNPNAMATTSGSWTNDRIFGFAHYANEGEIALGKLAATKATNSQVKAFGSQMVKDHQAMMGDLHKLMSKLNAAPDTTFDDAKNLAGDGSEKLKELTEKAKGADWDKNYIESQVDIHQRVLDKLTDAAKSTTDSTLTADLAKTSAKVQEHLTKAQSIKAGLK